MNKEDPVAVAEIKRLSNQIAELESLNAELLAACKSLLAEHPCAIMKCQNETCVAVVARSLIARCEKEQRNA